jgi:hypothetical protein
MRKGFWMLLVAMLLLVDAAGLAETYVLPAVVAGVPGLNGSFWETEVRVARLSVSQELVVRRAWVATATGGFVDDPVSGPRWQFPASSGGKTPRLLQLRGTDLLAGSGAASGAVALEVAGTVAVYLRSTNTANAGTASGTPYVTRGNGWLLVAPSVSLQGPSTIAWSTPGGASGMPGGSSYRTSVGLVNASATPVDVELRVLALGADDHLPGGEQDPRYWRDQIVSEPIALRVGALARIQLDDFYSSVWFCYPIGCSQGPGPEVPALILVDAPEGASLYVYSSVIFTPLNDPEIVLAVPGLPEGIPYP